MLARSASTQTGWALREQKFSQHLSSSDTQPGTTETRNSRIALWETSPLTDYSPVIPAEAGIQRPQGGSLRGHVFHLPG